MGSEEKKSEKVDSVGPEAADDKSLGMADKSHNVEFTNDPEVDKQVDAIVNEESDQLIELEDKERESRFDPPKTDMSIRDKIKGFFSAWWGNKKLRYSSLAGVFVLLSVLVFVPVTRYGILNIAGVRVDSSMTVVDSNTGLPLKNISVMFQGEESISDDEGNVSFSELKLGSTELFIEKIGYARYEKDITLGWGSNPIGPQPLTATGTEFSFILTDWLSGNAILDAEASSGENIAQSDDNGKIVLNVGELDSATTATIKVDGYRVEEILLLDVKTEDYAVSMVPGKKHVFVSNRDGQYDLYKIDVDGSNEEILLEATGKEREVPFVLPHPTKDFAAYISSRDGETNQDNFVLDGLFIVDVGPGDSRKITRSEQLQLIGWSGDKLIYVAVVEGVSAGNSERSKIFSYDINTGEKAELASSNYFNDVKLVNEKVYYGVSSYAVPNSAAKLFTVNPDGSDKVRLVDDQVWSIVRADFETILFNAINQQWFEQAAGGSATKLDQAPANRQGRFYSVSPNKDQAIWTDVRDGKGVLIKYDIASKSEEIIFKEAGVSTPIYWLSDNYIVFRISTNEETADYVLNLDGGEPSKISDVLGNRSRYFY